MQSTSPAGCQAKRIHNYFGKTYLGKRNPMKSACSPLWLCWKKAGSTSSATLLKPPHVCWDREAPGRAADTDVSVFLSDGLAALGTLGLFFCRVVPGSFPGPLWLMATHRSSEMRWFQQCHAVKTLHGNQGMLLKGCPSLSYYWSLC